MSIYDQKINTLEGEPADLSEYKGKALLVVNVASKCGLTPQYEGLEKLHETYGSRGFEVLGFPCNQFMGQEPGTSEEIREFCSTTYGVQFPIFEKIDVNGDQQHPLFAELEQQADADGEAGDVKWNFEKFLVSPSGDVVGRFRPQVTPEDPALVEAIEAQLPQLTVADADEAAAATKAYVYGYPLVYNLHEIARLATTDNVIGVAAPLNSFASARQLLDPTSKFVTPNNDTLYTVAACDVSAGPIVLSVPDTHDRYYVLQFVDAWTNNFAYVGRRATGTGAGTFLLTPHDYSGPVPDGVTVIHAPTSVFAIIGRLQVDGAADLQAVHELQDAFTLAPLDPSAGAPAGLPQPDPAVGDDLQWWEAFRVALAAFPPPPADAEYVDAVAALGLTAPGSPLAAADAALTEALVEGQQQGEALIEDLAKNALKIVDGWSSAMHGFDYNLDFFEIGTVDDAQWKVADRTKGYVLRAAAARAGLWGNHGYEARYDLLWQDEHGDELEGSHAYELTLAPPPAVDAFWSLTMYDEPDYYLVANDIQRYSVGDRTHGLVVGDDGSVTIRMSAADPGDASVNWLPAPQGLFRPVLRAYQPKGSTLDGTYQLPKVRKLS